MWKIAGKAGLDVLNCNFFFRLPTMVANRIFRHIPTDRPKFGMAAEKLNYLIMMTAGIQNVISSAEKVISGLWLLKLKFHLNAVNDNKLKL